MSKDYFNELKKEVIEIQVKYPNLSSDNAFVTWFMRAFITDDEKDAVDSITGKSADKSIDAIYLDKDNRIVFIVQGKYHQKNETTASRSDVLALADIGNSFYSSSKDVFESVLNKANSKVRHLLPIVKKLLIQQGYSLVLMFATTGKISATHVEEAESRVEENENIRFEVFAKSDLVKLMQDYIVGAAPPVPTINLPVSGLEVFNRHDKQTKITSWIFTMAGKEIGKIYNDIGIRLFARNIRGYLGASKEVNKMIKYTMDKEPQNFWYYNNGITIVCDGAKQIKNGSKNFVKVKNAQIINGQQTTRTLALSEKNSAEVLVKLIEVKRESEDSKSQFNHLIGEIVSATNWQNSISQSDLKSNDAEQVRIEKEFKKLGYFYSRKKMKKSEAVKYGADKYNFIINKEELARAIAAVTLDPYEVRLGVNRFFEEDLYEEIFDGRKAVEYISIYWLFKRTVYWTFLNEKYGYAKWLAVNFVWSQIKGSLKIIQTRDNFRFLCERTNKLLKELKPFDIFVKEVYAMILKFYNKNKKVDGKNQETINFFKHSNRHIEIQKFYSKYDKTLKRKMKNSLEKFVLNLNAISE